MYKRQVYSEGEFLDESLSTNKEKAEEVFGDMLEHLTQEASRRDVYKRQE